MRAQTSETGLGAFTVYRNFGAFRLVLALLVVVQHFFAGLAPESMLGLVQSFGVGSIAVLAFFALSGFVIIEAADQIYQGRPKSFFINRLLRVVPQYVLAVVIAVALFAAFSAMGNLRLTRGDVFPGDIAFSPQNLAFNLVGIFPLADRFMSFSFIDIAWAVRVEMTFYALVAVALFIAPLAAKYAKLPPQKALALTALAVAAATIPLFALALQGRGISMFQYVPYFTFGAALYYANAKRSTAAWIIVALSLAAIALHFTGLPVTEKAGFARNANAQGVLLIVLLAAMTALAFIPSVRFKAADRFLGELTYPLYMSHVNLVLVLLAFTSGYSALVLFAAFPLSLLLAYVSHQAVDPLVNRLRNAVRGRTL